MRGNEDSFYEARVVSLFAAVDPTVAPSYDVRECYCGGTAVPNELLCRDCLRLADAFGREMQAIERKEQRAQIAQQ